MLSKFFDCQTPDGTPFQVNLEHVTWVEYKQPGCVVLFDNGYTVELDYTSTMELMKLLEKEKE